MQSLKSSSKFYMKNNVLQGYHRIPISMKSRNLFCFALEDGLYRYIRAPMGYSGSSHCFNRIVQKIFEDIQDTHIEVDDSLTEADSMEEVIATFKKILVHCREKGIKLARHKLEFGREVDFAGTHTGVFPRTRSLAKYEGRHPETHTITHCV